MKVRPLRARPAVGVAPVLVSDEDASCYPVAGLTARRFRELVRTLDVPHVRLGRRILVRAFDLDEAMRRAVSAESLETTANDGPGDLGGEAGAAAPVGVDEVLAAIGRRRI